MKNSFVRHRGGRSGFKDRDEKSEVADQRKETGRLPSYLEGKHGKSEIQHLGAPVLRLLMLIRNVGVRSQEEIAQNPIPSDIPKLLTEKSL